MSTETTIAAVWEQMYGVVSLNSQQHGETFFSVPKETYIHCGDLTDNSNIVLGVCIGKGGVADVFSAHQPSLRRQVAVKQIRDQSHGDYLRFFHHEVWLMAGLNHPNILPVHGLVRIGGRPSLVMKRVNGEAWDEQLAEARFKETMVLHHEIQRLVDVCDAVAFAHSRGVLHLDLKPANVMCGAFGETLVMDWGCAALFDDSDWSEQPDLPRTSRITKPFGTPAFMAPELARGEGNALGPHTDIYLLGAILHLLLSGSPLRVGETVRTTIEMAAQGERLPLPETAPSQLADLCRHATEPNIADRLCDLSVFRDTLQHWLDTRESQALTERALETLSEMEKAETLTAAQRQEGTQLLGVFEQAGRSGMKLPQAIDGEWRMRSLLAQTALRNGEPDVARVLAIPMPKQQKEVVQKQAQELQAQQVQAVRDDAWVGAAISRDGGKSMEAVLSHIFTAQQRALGDEHPNTLSSKENIAALYKEQGKYDASESLYDEVLGSLRRILGKEHRRTLSTALQLASVYRQQGKYVQAETLFKKTVGAHVRHLGLEHSETLNATRLLAHVYQIRGAYASAESLHQNVLDTQKRTLGAEHNDTLSTLNSLAQLHKLQGHYSDAESLYLEVLETREIILGEDHPETLQSVNNLAGLFVAQGKLAAAEQLCVRALEGRKRTLGLEHPSTLNSIGNLAILYESQGQYTKAEALYLDAIDGYKSTLGLEHPSALNSIGNLAILYESQGRYAEAETNFVKALTGYKKVFGDEHSDTLGIASNFAQFLSLQGRYSEAEKMCRDVLTVRERILGKDHPLTLNSVNNLVRYHVFRADYEGAEALCLRALETRERTLGKHHPATLKSAHNLAYLYRTMGRYSEAESLFLKTLEAREYILGPENPATLMNLSNLAQVYQAQQRFAEAEPLFLRVLGVSRRLWGEEHLTTLNSMSNLAHFHCSQERYAEAGDIFQHVHDVREQLLGAGHPDAATSLNNLAWFQLRYTPLLPHALFQQLVDHPTLINGWRHHWARLGKALCTLKESGDDEQANGVLQDLKALLGAQHNQVQKAVEQINAVCDLMGVPEKSSES